MQLPDLKISGVYIHLLVIIIAAVDNLGWTQIKCCVNVNNIRIAAHFYSIIQLNNHSDEENVVAVTYTQNSFYKLLELD